MILKKLHSFCFLILLFSGLALVGSPDPASAQGTAQIIVTGIPPVLTTPYLSDLERSYRQGLFPVQFIYTSPSRLPRTFQFRLSLDVDGERLLEMISEPNSYEPGIHVYRTFDDEPAIRFPLTYGEWTARLNASIDETGLLPEGDYTLTIEPILEDQDALIPTLPGLAFFRVRYAEPPQLLGPFDGINLTTQFPIFSWTPVSPAPAGSIIEYELLIVEVYRDQTPYQALESNPERLREVLTEQTSFVYSFEHLPLEKGKTYAWQVRARDISDELPILEMGETEFHTFTVGAEGFGSMLTSWSYPVSSPLVEYEFENLLELDPSDTEIYFDGPLSVQFNGYAADAVFDRLLVDAETQSIIEGSLTVDEPIALEISINPLSDVFTDYSAVSSGSSLTLSEGLLLELGSSLYIDVNGLHPRGTQRAEVAYAGREASQWNATYSQDFTLSLTPFNITSGRVDFSANGVATAYADPTGFHLVDHSDPVIAQLPERLLLPGADLAYVPLKRGGEALVNAQTTESGALKLEPRSGAPLQLVLPALSSPLHAEALSLNAGFEEVVIDPASGALISGSVEAEVPESAAFTLDALGVPFAPSRFASDLTSGRPSLTMEGRLTLFGRTVRNTAPFELTLDEQGIITGIVVVEDADGIVYLDPAGQSVALHVSSALGSVYAPLRTAAAPSIDIDIESRFAVHDANEGATEAALDFHYTGDGPIELTRFSALPSREPAAFPARSLQLEIRHIDRLSLAYSFTRGISYTAAVQANMVMTPAGEALKLPLDQVELRNDGIVIPRQELHAGIPEFSGHSFILDGATYDLLAMRMPAGVVDIYRDSDGAPAGIDPYFDFDIHLNGHSGLDRSLASASLTLQDARLRDGRLSGSVLPYHFERQPARWHFEAGEMLVDAITGSLNRDPSREGLSFSLYGSFVLQPPAGASGARCIVSDVTLHVEDGRPVSGESASFTPCDLYGAGDFLARLNEAVLRVDADGRFLLDGTLAALQGRGSVAPAVARGPVTIDVVSEEMLEANAEVQRLSWLFPIDSPLFEMHLRSATLTSEGFAVSRDSAFTVTAIAGNATYSVVLKDDFRLGLRPDAGNRGRAELVARSNGKSAGVFSENGFQVPSADVSLPQRILLPGAAGAYLDVAGAGPDDIEFSRAAKEEFVFKTGNDKRVSLVLPSLGGPDDHPEIPVSLDLKLNELGVYNSGSFEQGLFTSPVDLRSFGYPLSVLRITYNENKPNGERLSIDAVLHLPPVLGAQTASTQSLPLTLTLTPSGLIAAPFESPSYAFYDNKLSLSVDQVHFERTSELEGSSTISGVVGGPVFGPESNLRYKAVFDATNHAWNFALDIQENETIAIQEATFQLDPESQPQLTTSPGIVLEMSGTMTFPRSIGDAFSVGITLEIGPGGIYVWPRGSFHGPQPLFNGLLTTHLDAVDLDFDYERQTIVATLDGAFSTRLTAGENIRGRSSFERLPFAAMRFGADGGVDFEGNRGSVSKLELLRGLPPISVIDGAFRVSSLSLNGTEAGLTLDLGGVVQLPDPSRLVPVSMHLDSRGGFIAGEDSLWTPRVFQDTASPPALAETSPLSGQYRLAAAYLDFSPMHPDRTALYLASGIYIRGVTGSGRDQSRRTASTVRFGLGEAWNPRRNPGQIVRQHYPRQYLVAPSQNATRLSFSIETPLARIEPVSITLANPAAPGLLVGGNAWLNVDGMSGALPIEGLAVGPDGITDFGGPAGPAQLAFERLAAFELGCFDYGRTARAGPIRIQAIDQCNITPSLTLTDRWMAGTYSEFTALSSGAGGTGFTIRGAEVDLSGLASLTATLSYEPENTALAINGLTRFRNVDFSSSGRLRSVNDLPGLSLAFSPTAQPLELIPNLASADAVGGGVFLRASSDDLDLVRLALDERSNGRYSPNAPEEGSIQTDRITALLPVEARLQTAADSTLLSGVGLLTATPQFSLVDLDGHFLNRPGELSGSLYLFQAANGADSLSLEGIADISLNYATVAGGIVKTNFYARSVQGKTADWGAFGMSNILLNDTVSLPGRFLMTSQGVVMDMHDTVDLKAGPLSIANDMNVSIWQERAGGQTGGYTAFDAQLDLIPGYSLANLKLYGGLIEDREEKLMYAANNIFVDVPFVYTGPIDPWISIQDGAIFGGDARNTTFRRMMADARTAGNDMPELSRDLARSLRQALDVQDHAASNLLLANDLSFFARPDSLLHEAGVRLRNSEVSALRSNQLPAALASIHDSLYEDPDHPDYGYFSAEAPNTLASMEAWQDMQVGLNASRRSAEADIYNFEGLTARPLVWSSDYVELISEVRSSPIQSIVWPLQAREGSAPREAPGFSLTPNVSRVQQNNLLSFKQNNEALDVQFLRAITGLELNLVNLKITRTPRQALDFARASSLYQRFAARQIADDWEMRRWTVEKLDWLRNQEEALERGIRDHLRAYSGLEESERAMRDVISARHASIQAMARNTQWKRDDLPEDQNYQQYLNELDRTGLETEFATTARNLWYDVPIAALETLEDTLLELAGHRSEMFKSGVDTLDAAYGRFSRALDPFYDAQTRFTAILYGMGEEYWHWRSSIRRLDPEAVNYAFQFVPYRGNYRILAEDLAPPVIEEIRVATKNEGYLSENVISWTADHPVSLADQSLSITRDTVTTTLFGSAADTAGVYYYASKPDETTSEQKVNVTLRVRGAGGVPAVKRGQFTVSLEPENGANQTGEEEVLVPLDETPPPIPVIARLAYSSYFTETPNTLAFYVDALRDDESGLSLIEYRIVNDRNREEVLQDWTALQKSTEYFSGRLVETSLPVQEKDVTVRVFVRATNGAGLRSEQSESLALDLDDSPPSGSIVGLSYFNAFDIEHPSTLKVELSALRDAQSGIDNIEYAFLQNAQAMLANAVWRPLLTVDERLTDRPAQSVYLDMSGERLPEETTNLSMFVRITNGAGLQTIANQAVLIPPPDRTPPSEPIVELEHSLIDENGAPHRLRIITSGSQDFESGIASVSYRVLDGSTGAVLLDWDDFAFIDPNYPTYIFPATEKTITLPALASSRTIIVEAETTNRAGLTSRKTVAFAQIDLDDTPPSTPSLEVTYQPVLSAGDRSSLEVVVGASEDPESAISDVSYRLIDRNSQQVLRDWTSLLAATYGINVLPGLVAHLDAAPLPMYTPFEMQVRVTNSAQLSTFISAPVLIQGDDTPPAPPNLTLSLEREGAVSELTLTIGETRDAQSGLSSLRYRVRNPAEPLEGSASWRAIPLRDPWEQFAGRTLRETLEGLPADGEVVVEVEARNGAGRSTLVSGIVGRRTAVAPASAAPAVELFYFDADNSIRSNALEFTLSRDPSGSTPADSIHYRVNLVDAAGASLLPASRSRWQLLSSTDSYLDTPKTVYVDVPEFDGPATASIELRLSDSAGRISRAFETSSLDSEPDTTPPPHPRVEARYAAEYLPERANRLDLFIDRLDDPESRLARVDYRIVDEADTSRVIVDWSPVTTSLDRGILEPTTFAVDLPEFSQSITLRVSVAAVNGAGLERFTQVSVPVVIDRSPPEFSEPKLSIAGLYDPYLPPRLVVNLGDISDEESIITEAAYRIYMEGDSTALDSAWTTLDVPRSHFLRVPAITRPIDRRLEDQVWHVDSRVRNASGLSASQTGTLRVESDDSAPQMPPIDLSYQRSAMGGNYLRIAPGAFRDIESQIAAIDYRIVAARDRSNILVDWISLPVPRADRVSVQSIAVPREKIPFAGAAQIAVVFRAVNGAGLQGIREATIALPGDETPPETPGLVAAHRNAYDPLNPNTIEVQIGSSMDEQSAIASARYRIVEPSTGIEFATWTPLDISPDGFFPGTVLFEDLPLLQNNTSLRVDLEVVNSAGLSSTASQQVRVVVAGDRTPPNAAVALYNFGPETALVLEELSDPESKIQQVEYRLLDNVDQTELSGWTNLFEIPVPQTSYPRQSYAVELPETNIERTLKVEVRVTNGAGLQTVVSRTVPLRSNGEAER